MEPSQTDGRTDLREYLRVVRTRRWSIVLVTVVLTGAALFFSFRQTPTYQTTARVLVETFSQDPTQLNLQTIDLDTEQGLVATEPVARLAARTLGTTWTPASLLSGLSVDAVPNTQFLLIHYSSASPRFAASAANAFADGYITYRRDTAQARLNVQRDGIDSQVAQAQARLAELNRIIATSKDENAKNQAVTERDTLLVRLTTLDQERQALVASITSIQSGGGQVVDPAAVPRHAVSPNPIRTGTLAAVLGLVLGTGVAFVRERLDDGVHSREEIERRLGAPVLATIPPIIGMGRREEPFLVTVRDPKNPASEAYRTLRTNLQFLTKKGDLQTLMVTSALVGDGKTATASNLAVTMAQAGRRVVLVAADLRRPGLQRFLDMPNDVGLSTVLADSTPVWKVAQHPGVENLRVVLSGPSPPNPAELLQGERMAEVIQQLRGMADLVIVDAPPVLAVADASIIAQHVDGTLFVVDLGTASRTATTQARDQLENAGARTVGVVLNRYDPRQSGMPYYYYHYYYQSPEQDPEGRRGRGRRGRRGNGAPPAGDES